MNLYCLKEDCGALGFPPPQEESGVLVSSQAICSPDHYNVGWIDSIDKVDDNLVGRMLRMDQIWAPEHLVSEMQSIGLPGFRIRPCSGPEEMEALKTKLIAELQNRKAGLELVWRGTFGDNGSLSIVNSMICQSLEKQGWRVHLLPRHGSLLEMECPGVSLSWPPAFHPPTRGPFVLFAPWEFGFLPQEWMEKIPLVANRLWMTSEHSKSGAVRSGCNPDWVEIAYPGIDPSQFNPSKTSIRKAEEPVSFLFVGGLVRRKGIDILQKAWEMAFQPEDNVRLIIKAFGSGNHYQTQSVVEKLRQWIGMPGLAPVELITKDVPSSKLPDLYRAADVTVLPYRAEGFCMPALESMACSVPVVIPEHGPTDEFCQRGGWKVPVVPFNYHFSEIPLSGPALEKEIQPEDLAQILQKIVENPEQIKQQGQIAWNEAQAWTWDHAAKKITEDLMQIKTETPIHRIKPQRPEGNRLILGLVPDLSQPEWAQAIIKADEIIRESEEGEGVTIALWASEEEEESLLQDLTDFPGLSDIQTDITIAVCPDPLEMLLGCDAVLSPWDKKNPSVGKPHLSLADVAKWIECQSE